MIRSLALVAILFCGLMAEVSSSDPLSAPSPKGPDAEVITAAESDKTTAQKDDGAPSPAIPVQTTPVRVTDPPLKSKSGKPLSPEDIREYPVIADPQPVQRTLPPESLTHQYRWEGLGGTFSMPVGIRQQHVRLRHAQLTLEKLKATHGDLHASVTEQKLVIQSLESTLQSQTELFDILTFTRSEVAEKKDAAEVEHGQLHPEVVRLDGLLARLDERIKVIEEAGPDEPSVNAMPQPATSPNVGIKVFLLKYCDAGAAAELLRELIADKSFRAGADVRINAMIVTGTAEQLQSVEALLLKLDKASAKELPVGDAQLDELSRLLEDAYQTDAHLREAEADTADIQKRTTQSPDDRNAVTSTQADGPENEAPHAGIGIPANELQQQIAQLRKDYGSADQQAHQLAESLRKSSDTATKAKLRSTVQQAFALRQSLLRAELMEMQTRLLQTQRSINMRERIADQIVDSRVEDLLNPQLEWESSSNTDKQSLSTKDSSTASFPGLNQTATDPPEVFTPVGESISSLRQRLPSGPGNCVHLRFGRSRRSASAIPWRIADR
ncbi:MAG: secretin N-terminal domain-containing protein [Fuerstiella sp.]